MQHRNNIFVNVIIQLGYEIRMRNDHSWSSGYSQEKKKQHNSAEREGRQM